MPRGHLLRRTLLLSTALAAVLAARDLAGARAAPRQGTEFCTTPELSKGGHVTEGMSVTLGPEGSPYHVDCNAEVDVGGTLTIQPGVRLEFGSNRNFQVRGTLVMNGAQASDIVLTSDKPSKTPGDWDGMKVHKGATATLVGFSVEYGGRSSAALTIEQGELTLRAARLAFGDNNGLRISNADTLVEGVEIVDNRVNGIQIAESSSSERRLTTVTLNNVTIQRNTQAAVLSSANVQMVMNGNRVSDNGVNAVSMGGTIQYAPLTFRGGDMPYVLTGLTYANGQALTFEPGAIVKLTSSSGLTFNPDSQISVAGSAELPVYFTALSDDAACLEANRERITCDTNNDGDASSPSPLGGNWQKITFTATSLGGSIDHAVLRYGANEMLTLQGPGVTLSHVLVSNANGTGLRVDRVPATITDSRFVQNRGPQNAGNGIQVDTLTPITVTIRNSVFEQNGRAAVSRDPNAALITGGNSTPGFSNQVNGYAVEQGDLQRSQTWLAGDLPYVLMSNLRVDMTDPVQTLTFQPGLTVKVADNQALTINRGRLRSGAKDGPKVLVTSLRHDLCADDSECDTNGDGITADPLKGIWGAISVERTSRGAFLPNTTVRFGGSDSFDGAIYLKHSDSSIENTEVSDSGTAGIRVEGVNQTLLADNYIHDNNGAGILLNSSNTDMKARLERNRIHNNKNGGAVELDANVEVLPLDNEFPTGNKYNGLVVRGQARVTRTWHKSNMAYVVPQDVQVVNRDARLVIEPGTVVKFDPNGFVLVSGGSLIAEGDAGDKIYFTSIHDDTVGGNTDGVNLTPTGWRNIEFKDTGQGGRIVYAEVRGAGSTTEPAIDIGNAAVTVQNSLIADGLGTGIHLAYPGKDAQNRQPVIADNIIRRQIGPGIAIVAGNRPLEPTIRGNKISQTGGAAITMDANVEPIHEGNEAVDCAVNGILLLPTSMAVKRRWTSTDLVYVISGGFIIGNGELQIDAGAVVKLTADATLTVDRGRLTIPTPGSGTDPVFFTALLDDTCGVTPTGCDTGNDGESVPFAGYWGRIVLNPSSAVSSLKNLRIAYGGSGSSGSQLFVRKGVNVEDSVIAYSAKVGMQVTDGLDMVVRRNLFQDNVDVALVLDGSSTGVADGNVFTGNGRSIRYRSSGLVQMSNNVAIGNDVDAMDYCANVTEIQSWQSDLPREVTCSVNVRPGATLSIEPGVLLKIAEGFYFGVSGLGTRLDAEGALFTLAGGEESKYWGGLRFAKDSGGSLRHNYFIQGGNVANGLVDIQANSPFEVAYNTMLRSQGMGVYVHLTNNQDTTITGNLLRQVDGSNSVAINVDSADAKVTNNRLADADTGIRLRANGPDTFLTGNNLSQMASWGVQNRDRTKCVDAQANWWGDATGPYDPSRDGNDPCNSKTPNKELVNEQGQGLKVSDWVDYQNWLKVEQPSAPVVDLPLCGVSNRSAQTVRGSTSPGATVNIYDDTSATPDTPVASTTAGADGRFETTVNLDAGSHKLSFAATRADTSTSARTSFRAMDIQTASPIDPAGIRFEFGPHGGDSLPRAQPLRDEAGCAIACGGPSAGRVTLPAAEPVTLKVPAVAGVTGVDFVQNGQAQALTAGAGGLWTLSGLKPANGPFLIRAKGAAAVDCQGYAYVGGASGFVFLDSGVQGVDDIASYGFETEPPIWTSEPPNSWSRTNTTAHSGQWSAADSPGTTGDQPNRYKPNTNASFYPPSVFDLRFTPAPQVSFWHKYQLGKGDRLYVEARTDPDSSWQKLEEWTDSSPPAMNWEPRVVSLEKYSRVRTLWIRWRLQANSDDSVGDGWFIDDVVVGPGGKLNGRYDPGEPVLPNAKVLLLQGDLDRGVWNPWDGRATGQPNPQTTDALGRYGFYYLPAGEYRVQVTPQEGSGLAPATTGSVVVWGGALTENVALAGSTPLFFPIVMRGYTMPR